MSYVQGIAKKLADADKKNIMGSKLLLKLLFLLFVQKLKQLEDLNVELPLSSTTNS